MHGCSGETCRTSRHAATACLPALLSPQRPGKPLQMVVGCIPHLCLLQLQTGKFCMSASIPVRPADCRAWMQQQRTAREAQVDSASFSLLQLVSMSKRFRCTLPTLVSVPGVPQLDDTHPATHCCAACAHSPPYRQRRPSAPHCSPCLSLCSASSY